jgi:hypothetical protein
MCTCIIEYNLLYTTCPMMLTRHDDSMLHCTRQHLDRTNAEHLRMPFQSKTDTSTYLGSLDISFATCWPPKTCQSRSALGCTTLATRLAALVVFEDAVHKCPAGVQHVHMKIFQGPSVIV